MRHILVFTKLGGSYFNELLSQLRHGCSVFATTSILNVITEETESSRDLFFGVVVELLKNSGEVGLSTCPNSGLCLVFEDLDELAGEFHDLVSDRCHLCHVFLDAFNVLLVHVVVLLSLAQNYLSRRFDRRHKVESLLDQRTQHLNLRLRQECTVICVVLVQGAQVVCYCLNHDLGLFFVVAREGFLQVLSV